MRNIGRSKLTERLKKYRLVQGPLAGVSTMPFRELIWQYSQPAWVCSEMISAKSILCGRQHILRRYLSISPNEGPLSIQIATADADEAARACTELNQYDISLVDLNAGCPVKKIRQRSQGSSLLSQAKKLEAIIIAMRSCSNFPISVKIRVDGHCSDYNKSVLDAVNSAMPDFLIVHARSYQDGYDVAIHTEQLAYFTEHALMPVIGNGDVADAASTNKILALGCDAAMISRASVGAPWLINQIQYGLKLTQTSSLPSMSQRWPVFVQHISALAKLLGHDAHAIAHAQGLVKYYARHNNFSRSTIATLRTAQSLDDLLTIIAS